MEVSSTMRHVHVIVLSLITLETDVKVCVYGGGGVYKCVHVSKCGHLWDQVYSINYVVVMVN